MTARKQLLFILLVLVIMAEISEGKPLIKKEDITIKALVSAHPSVPWPFGAISKLNREFTKNPKTQKIIDNLIFTKSIIKIIAHLPIPG